VTLTSPPTLTVGVAILTSPPTFRPPPILTSDLTAGTVTLTSGVVTLISAPTPPPTLTSPPTFPPTLTDGVATLTSPPNLTSPPTFTFASVPTMPEVPTCTLSFFAFAPQHATAFNSTFRSIGLVSILIGSK